MISVPALFELPQSAATSRGGAARRVRARRAAPGADRLGARGRLARRRRRRRHLARLRPRRRHVRRVAARDPRRPAPRGRPRRRQLPRRPRLRLGDHRAPRVAARRSCRAATTPSTPARCARSGSPPRTRRSSCRAATRAQVTLAQPLVDRRPGGRRRSRARSRARSSGCARRSSIARSTSACACSTAHGLAPGRLARVVLVGGPTVMPMVRARVAARLEARDRRGPRSDDAGRAGRGALRGDRRARRPRRADRGRRPGRQVWLQYPAVSSDLTPHVVGKFVGADPPAKVKLVRSDGAWTSAEATVGARRHVPHDA